MFLQTLRQWLTPRPRAARGTRRRVLLESLEDRTSPAIFIVYGFGGSDVSGIGSAAAPFQSIQRAVNVAQNGDTIKVAGGLYQYAGAQDQFLPSFGTTAVVDVINKQLNIIGSYTPADGFTTPNFGLTPSVIDGSFPGFGRLVRGVLVTATGPGLAALNMQNFFIQNGTATGIAARAAFAGGATDGHGGGMLVERSPVTLNNVVFATNISYGVSDPAASANSSPALGGVGAGGGLALFGFPGEAPVTANLSNLTFYQNAAIGGNGTTVGGFGQGGGLFANLATVNGTNLAFGANLAQGGLNTGGGVVNGIQTGDGFGGGADFEQSTATLNGVTAVQNVAKGGLAFTGGVGGNGLGGALEDELGNVSVGGNSLFQNNVALGGDGGSAMPGVGSLGSGGAIDVTNGNFTLDSASVTGNTAQGGNNGSGIKPGPLGGGIHAVSTLGTRNNITLTNTVIAGNSAVFGSGQGEQGGGSGGGASFNASNVTIATSRFDNNTFGNASVNLQGQALAANSAAGLGSVVSISGTSITNHKNSLNPRAAAVDVFPGNSATFSNDTFSGNTKNTNADGQPFPAGTFIGLPGSQF
jgi:hypothetical protein